MAWQEQRRADVSVALELRDGLVWISRARIAESRSLSVLDAPCMGMPPDRAILAFGADVFMRTFGRSEMSVPAAEGGGFGDGLWEEVAEADLGGCGFSLSENVVAAGAVLPEPGT